MTEPAHLPPSTHAPRHRSGRHSAAEAPGTPLAPEPSPASGPAQELDLWLIVAVVKKRAILIGAIVVAFSAIAAVRAWSQEPVYAAAATIHLSKEPPDPTSAKYVIAYEGLVEEYLNTQTRIVRSRKIAAAVLEKDAGIARDVAGAGDPVAMIQGGITVHPVPQSYLVEIGYEHGDPTRVARYANAVASAYVAYIASDRETKTRTAEKNLADQLPILERKLSLSERELQRFLDSPERLGFEQQQSLGVERLRLLSETLLATQRDRLKAEGELESINALLAEGRPIESAPAVAASALVGGLRTQLGQTELELAQLQERGYGEAWPRVRQLMTRRDELKLRIRSEIETIRAGIHSFREAKRIEESSIQRLVEGARDEARRLEQQALQYKNLKAEVEANRRFYDEFSQRLKEISAYSQVDVSNVRVLDWARPPGGPIRPNRPRDLMLGTILGLAIGLGLAVLLEFMDERLRAAQDVQSHLGLPVLALIPSIEDVPEAERDRLAISQPSSGFAESFRRLRAQVEARIDHAGGGAVAFLVTSAGVSEGKTLTSINLAVAMANTGLRVALVDGDMRNPRVHRVLSTPLVPGLAETLEGHSLPDGTEHIPRLTVIPAGKASRNPAELLAGGGSFERVLAELRSGFDRVIIDAPPSAALSDPSLLAPYVDAVLFVVSAGTTARRAAQLGKASLEGVGVTPLGVVLNNVSESDLLGLYGYGYGYYNYVDGPGSSRRTLDPGARVDELGDA